MHKDFPISHFRILGLRVVFRFATKMNITELSVIKDTELNHCIREGFTLAI